MRARSLYNRSPEGFIDGGKPARNREKLRPDDQGESGPHGFRLPTSPRIGRGHGSKGPVQSVRAQVLGRAGIRPHHCFSCGGGDIQSGRLHRLVLVQRHRAYGGSLTNNRRRGQRIVRRPARGQRFGLRALRRDRQSDFRRLSGVRAVELPERDRPLQMFVPELRCC